MRSLLEKDGEEMTDKQSTVDVSRELFEAILDDPRLVVAMPSSLIAQIKAILAATPEQAVDVGEPVAWLDEESGAIVTEKLKHVLCEDGFEIPLYRHAQPAAKVVLPEQLHSAELEELEVIEVLLSGQGLGNLAGAMSAGRQFIDEVTKLNSPE